MILKHLPRTGLGLLLVCMGAGYYTPAMAQQYYKWVDQKGSTHYTVTPPPKSAKHKGKINTYGWRNSAPLPAPSAQESNPPVTSTSSGSPTTAPAQEPAANPSSPPSSQPVTATPELTPAPAPTPELPR